MSFGRPPSVNIGFKPNPPERGAFPLDHYGECKQTMAAYMKCLKEHESTSTPCRYLSKEYLNCRMNKGLMERDDWKNLGLPENSQEQDNNSTKNKEPPPPSSSS